MSDHKHGDIQRKKSEDVESFEDPLQHLWAISYADLLMVILAFFVVYDVSPNKDKVETKLEKSGIESVLKKVREVFVVKKNTGDKTESSESSNSQSPVSENKDTDKNITLELKEPTGPKVSVEDYEKIKKILKSHEDTNMQLVVNDEYKELIVHFDGEFYKPGVYIVSDHLRSKLIKLTGDIREFAPLFVLEIIGHADETPVSDRLRKKGISSNTVLSAMRAAHASEIVSESGYRSDHIVISGHGEKGHKSKTLTFRLRDIANLSNEGFRETTSK